VSGSDRDEPKGGAERELAPLRRLGDLARPEWRSLAAGACFLVVASAMGLAYPQAIRKLLDTALREEDLGRVDLIALAMLVIFVVQAVAFGMRYYLFTVAGERIVTRLRERVYESIMQQEIAFFDERRTGELTSRLSSDTTMLRNAVTVDLTLMVREIVLAVGGTALLFVSEPKLALLMLAIVPPGAALAVFMSRSIARLSRDVQDALGDAGSVAQETISGIRTVRAFTGEASALASYGRAVQRSFTLSKRRARSTALLSALTFFCGYAAISTVIWYGGRLVVSDSMSVGSLVMFVIYSMIVAFSLASIGERWAAISTARGAAERVFGLMDRRPTVDEGGGARPASVRGRIELARVGFAYPTRPAERVLTDIDLVIEPGEVVALVGPSGSGKSTIASLIPRFYDPDRGVVRFDDRDVRELDATWLRGQIGIVSQEPILFSDSIALNVRYGRAEATDAEVEAALRAANALDFVATLGDGADTQVGERGVQLSAGQKQRIAIARAVLKDPRVLILDEATSALDAESEHLVQEALDRLMRGRTTLIIAHRLSTVRGAHRVLVVDGGAIVQQGSHDELMQDGDGLYRRLVRRQFAGA
jgi:ATP-binding cassette subfamily B protein